MCPAATERPSLAPNMSLTAHEDELLSPDTIVTVSGDGDGLSAVPPGIPALPRRAPVADAPVRFKIRLATSEGRRSAASYLIQKMYGWRGYAANDPEPAPHRLTLVASDGANALATITIGFDTTEGLLVEQLYGPEVAKLRAAGALVCEFTKLAVERNSQSREVLAMMFHIAYMYATHLHGRTDLVIEVNPRHVRFYERMLGFARVGDERICPRVGAPAVLMWLRLDHARQQIAAYGGRRERASEVRSLYPFFFSAEEEDGIVRRLRAIG